MKIFKQSATLAYIDCQRSIQHVNGLHTATLLTLSLTICMTALAYQISSGAALVLAQWVAGVNALLHLAVMYMLARIAFQGARVMHHLRSGGKYTDQSKQLNESIHSVFVVMLVMFPFAAAALALPSSLPVVMRKPEMGMFFVMLIAGLLMHRYITRCACQDLSVDIPAAQQAAERTLVL